MVLSFCYNYTAITLYTFTFINLLILFIDTLHNILPSGVSRISFRGGSKFFWKSGGICMARSAMQRVAKPRVC